MKLVVAIIRPERLEAVQEKLGEAKVFRLTVSDVQGIAPAAPMSAAASYASGGASALSGGGSGRPERRVKLEIAVNEAFVEPTVRAITAGARLEGEAGGGAGSIFVLPLEETIRIRTGERGPDAI